MSQHILKILLFVFSSGLALMAEPAKVVVVYNSDQRDSQQLAQYYAKKRDIPKNNLIGLPLSNELIISRLEFVDSLHNPLLKKLVDQGHIAAAWNDEKDSLGRLMAEISDVKIRYMVLIYGVPTHVAEQPELEDSALREQWFSNPSPAAHFIEGPLAKNEASVDGELAMLWHPRVPVQGFIPNPLFKNQDHSNDAGLLRVTRLDGPSPRVIRRMIDYAIETEQKGLKGAAYVDMDGRDGGYAEGNQWLRRTHQIFEQLGFETFLDEKRSIFSVSDRMDAPALYAGWYNQNLAGTFTLPGFRFPPGAIAVHIHSFSAQNLRQSRRNWCGPLLERGATATLGNTAEPFLQFSHNIDAFFFALGNGWNLADAAYFALPVLSWQGVVLGDPLYQPFKVGLASQLEKVGGASGSIYDAYALMRAMNLALRQDQRGEALRTGRRGLFQAPSVALGLKVAEILIEMEEPEAALRSLGFAKMLPSVPSQEWIIMAQIAEIFAKAGEPGTSRDIMQKILGDDKLPKVLEIHLLRMAIPLADQANDAKQALDWRVHLNELTAPPTPAE